ncbi:hypothetical protein LAZ67_17000951 [Cordylochernes scorpioides]|uniref:Transposase n=1 Tax=Cordylochernes scorpioides TaxID=51811 RepID=A0ABY6LF43_9ARAC|nr:hypothetical protein LAZ67_17000951 [Cordylochernes scorpioides]
MEAPLKDCTTLEQRAVIRFLNAEGIQTSQICQRIKNIYGESCLSKKNYKWVNEFKNGRITCTDIERPGRPSVTATPSTINAVENLILEHRKISIFTIADNLNISYGTVHTIIEEQLQFRKICCRWIPHFLNLDQKLNRIRVSKALLKRYEEEGDHFLDQIATGDESWCYHYDPSTKRAYMEWKRGDSPRPKKKSGLNVRLGVLFLHDNARPHTSCKTVSTIIKLGFEVLEHPAYSPDLALSDYFLFGLLKKELKGKRFDSDEDVQKVVQDYFHTLPKNAYKEGIYKFPERWRRCIESQVKNLKAEGLDVGKATICRVVNGIGKKREAESNGQKFQVDRPRPVRTPATVSKVKRLATTENPPSQRQLSRMCGTSLKTINNIIHKDLELDTRRKGKVHKLTPFHMKNRATNARKLYEEHLAGSRSEYTATLDEAWMYVTYCNGIRKICYIKRGNQVPDNWVHHAPKLFLKVSWLSGVMTGRGVLPLIKVPSKVKVNSEFYIECVLKPVIEQLKDLYPGEMDKVFLHHDKASSHTSNKTQQFLQEMKDTLGLNFIRNSDIPVKSPDASPLDFYGFGMLKQRLFNRRPKTEAGLWKAAQEEWSNVSLSKVKEVFAAWKVRCREIAKKKGNHIEHMKKIHVRKIKF